MSKKTTYLLGILATLIIGFFLHWYFCCNKNCTKTSIAKETSQEKAATMFPFTFDDGDIAISSNDNFNFMSSDHAIVLPLSEDLMSCIKEMITHLKNNKDKKLNISGYFKEGENNLSHFENLGVARAKAIKQFLIEHGLSADQVSAFGKKDNSLTPNQSGILRGPYAFTVESFDGVGGRSKRISAMKNDLMKDPVLVRFFSCKSNYFLIQRREKETKSVSQLS
ncbi:hypothetical protein N9K85_01355 [Flavobacteriaceae bacterium]|nr:hypothetical protein [Flavobacteriaceae bacterium]